MNSPKQELMKNDRFKIASKDARSFKEPRAPVRSTSSRLGSFLEMAPKKDHVESDEASRGGYSTVSKMFRRQKKSHKEPTPKEPSDPAYLKKLDGFLSQKAASSRRLESDEHSRGAYSTASKIHRSSRYNGDYDSQPSRTRHSASSRHLSSTTNVPESSTSSRHLTSSRMTTSTERTPVKPSRTTSSSVLNAPTLSRAATTGSNVPEDSPPLNMSPRRKNRKIVSDASTRHVSSPRRLKQIQSSKSLSNFQTIQTPPKSSASKHHRHHAASGESPTMDANGEMTISGNHVRPSHSKNSTHRPPAAKHRTNTTSDTEDAAVRKPTATTRGVRTTETVIAGDSVMNPDPSKKSRDHRGATDSSNGGSVTNAVSRSGHGQSRPTDSPKTGSVSRQKPESPRSSRDKSSDPSRNRSSGGAGSKSVNSRRSRHGEEHKEHSRSKSRPRKQTTHPPLRQPSLDGGDFSKISSGGSSRDMKHRHHDSSDGDPKQGHRHDRDHKPKKTTSSSSNHGKTTLKTSHLQRMVEPEQNVERAGGDDLEARDSTHSNTWRPKKQNMEHFGIENERSMERFVASSNDDETPISLRRRTSVQEIVENVSSSLHHRIPNPKRYSSFCDDEAAIQDASAILASSSVAEDDVSESNRSSKIGVLDGEYDDVFTCFIWSKTRQDEETIRMERQKLRESIRDTLFFQAYEKAVANAETTAATS